MAWPKLTKNASFGPNLVVFGQKILIITGEIKSFVTHITENPPRHLVCIGFWSGMEQNGQKKIWPVFFNSLSALSVRAGKVIFLKLPFKTSKCLDMFAPVVKYILQSQCFFKELMFPQGKNSCKVISSKMILSLKKKLPAIHLYSESCFPKV